MKLKTGKDIKGLEWSFLRGADPFDWSLAQNIVVYALQPKRPAIHITPLSQRINGNIIELSFLSSDCPIGDYNIRADFQIPDITLPGGVVNDSQDWANAFSVVEHSYQEDLTGATFTTVLKWGINGLDADLAWLKANPDKTYADYIAMLRQPATEAATLATDAAAAANEAADSANNAATGANQAAGNAEDAAALANQKAALANEAAGSANNAATGANQAAGNAEDAAALANQKAALANEAADSANNAATGANQAAGNAEDAAALANQKAALANEAADSANNAATGANQAAGNAEDAAALANQKAALANEAALAAALSKEQADAAEALRQQQEDARKSAETARNVASNVYNVTLAVPLTAGSYYTATTARAAVPAGVRKRGLELLYETASGVWFCERFTGASVTTWTTSTDWEVVPNKLIVENIEEVAAEALVLLKNRIDALQKIIQDMILGSVQVDTLDVIKAFNLHGSSNLILTGTTTPTGIPDFVGQFYIKTSATTACYQATGNSSVGEWKQIG